MKQELLTGKNMNNQQRLTQAFSNAEFIEKTKDIPAKHVAIVLGAFFDVEREIDEQEKGSRELGFHTSRAMGLTERTDGWRCK